MVSINSVSDTIKTDSSDFEYVIRTLKSEIRYMTNGGNILFSYPSLVNLSDWTNKKKSNYSDLEKLSSDLLPKMKSFTSKDKFYTLEYALCENKDAKFINICGLCVDADSLIVALGLNPNPNAFIGVMSFKEIINAVLFGNSFCDFFDDEDYRLLLEDLKLYSGQNDIISTVTEFIEAKQGTTDRFESVTLNLVNSRYYFKYKSQEIEKFFDYSNNGDLLHVLINICTAVAQQLEGLGDTLFRNYIIEDNVQEFNNVSSRYTDEIMLSRGETNKHTLEVLRTKYISLGFSNDFLGALLSYGLGKNKRRKLYSEYIKYTNNHQQDKIFFCVMSSMSYVEIYTNGRVTDGIDIVKSLCYNILDLVHSIGWEQDMFFAYEIEHNYKISKMIEALLQRFDLYNVLNVLGVTEEEFKTYVISYGARFSMLMDCGSMYSRKVREEQYQLGTFSVPMIHNSGRVFNKVSKRLLKKL